MSSQMPGSNPWGQDFWLGVNSNGILDGDPGMRLQSGRALLIQRLLCRQTTPRGSVIDSPNDCIDIRDFLSDGMTNAQIAGLGGVLRSELLKDEQVLDVVITGSFVNATSTLTLNESFQSRLGPFKLVLAVTAVTVQLLDANLTGTQ